MANIVETAQNAGSFRILVAAVQAAGLVETLSGAGPFTVLAPSDEAFDQLPSGALDKLLADKAALTKILTYHVVAGAFSAGDIGGISTLTTLEGGDLTIDATGDNVRIDSAVVIQPDIKVDNGVIHGIDAVLVPLDGLRDAGIDYSYLVGEGVQ